MNSQSDPLNVAQASGKSTGTIVNKISGYASLLLGFLLLIALLGFISSLCMPEIHSEWLNFVKNNWLIIIFRLMAGIGELPDDPLHGVNVMDMIILLLFSVLCFGAGIAGKKTGRILTRAAFIVSLLAIVLFIATQIAGRSTVMLSVILLSTVLLIEKTHRKGIIISGIFAGLFLLIGDFTVGIHSKVIAIFFFLGYVLLTIWFFLWARMLLSR